MKQILVTAVLSIAMTGCCTKSDVDSQWEAVITSGGCMMGYDDWIPADTTSWEGWSVSSCWKRITAGDPEQVIPFLIEKLPSRRATGVHVDPFDFAIEGELAVYVLQHITHKNWYQYQGADKKLNAALKERQVREREPPERYSDHPNDQALLQGLLADNEPREALKYFFTGNP